MVSNTNSKGSEGVGYCGLSLWVGAKDNALLAYGQKTTSRVTIPILFPLVTPLRALQMRNLQEHATPLTAQYEYDYGLAHVLQVYSCAVHRSLYTDSVLYRKVLGTCSPDFSIQCCMSGRSWRERRRMRGICSSVE